MSESSNKLYFAIIGDIVNSQSIEDRRKAQSLLNKVLARVNEEYEKSIGAKFLITLGDEFQGLLVDGGHILDIVRDIEKELYPIRIRFGIGLGEITTEFDPEQALGADGPAYYCARRALDSLKNKSHEYLTADASIRVDFNQDNDTIEDLLNALFSTIYAIESSWNKSRWEIAFSFQGEGGKKQTEIAKELGMSQPNVSKEMYRGKLFAHTEAVGVAAKTFAHILPSNEATGD